jgi:iron uptake system component EfeO
VLPRVLPLLLLLTACGGGGGDDAALRVTAADSTCTSSAGRLASGTSRLEVSNAGKDVTEVYVYGPGDAIVGEVENLAPGARRDLVVTLRPGTYTVACKPGQTGRGIRTALTVTGSAATEADPRVDAAVASYTAWVQGQVVQLLPAAKAFTDAVIAGDTGRAKALYAPSRVAWERIEPVAESFGDLDPRIDARESDVPAGTRWTGWHQLEKSLWTTGTADPAVARRLTADLGELARRVATVQLTAAAIGNGAKELLDEVATGKITGEEERYSHTDLVDFQANLDGARQAYTVLRPVLLDRDRALADDLDARFATVQRSLAAHGHGASFVSYASLTREQVRALAADVDAVSEPLARLTAAVLT